MIAAAAGLGPTVGAPLHAAIDTAVIVNALRAATQPAIDGEDDRMLLHARIGGLFPIFAVVWLVVVGTLLVTLVIRSPTLAQRHRRWARISASRWCAVCCSHLPAGSPLGRFSRTS
ncbi:MAG TPA: hypothetical protein VFM14_08070 [Gemmatimonadales bacterium]|nr:hypothetical protein [Gemmatimonadales bacterium]